MTYIDSEKVYEFAKEQRVKETGGFSKGLNKGLQIMMSAARNRDAIPAADVVEVRHGRWHDVYMSSASSFVGTCSVCGISNDIPPVSLAQYCPNCGAKMDAKDTNVPSKDGGQDDA